jgi:hypothetical protein
VSVKSFVVPDEKIRVLIVAAAAGTELPQTEGA